MKPITLLVIASTLAGTVVGHAAQQATVITSGQAGMAQLIGEFPGMQGTAPKPMEIGDGLILGRVVDGVENSGVGGAIVTLSLAGFTPVRVQADGEGRFVFRALPKGTYSIATTRPGYVDGASGRTRPGGPTRGVTLTAEERAGDVEIPMWRYAAIAGVVLDENNEPLVGAQIRVLRRDYVAGRRRLTLGATDTTDDRGQYRIGSLEAGDYVVALPMIHRPSMNAMLDGIREGAPMGGGGGGTMVAMRVEATASVAAAGAPMIMTSSLDGTVPPAGTNEEGLPLTYQTEFYSGAVAAARATPVTLTHGEERTGLDFKIAPVRALSVSGTAIGPEGPMANVQLQLFPADADELVSPIETATANTDGDGNFTFAMVPTGAYSLRAIRQARGGGESFSFTTVQGAQAISIRQTVLERPGGAAPLPEEPTLWADMNVGVGTRDVTELAVNLRPGLTVSGSVVFQGGATQPTPEQRSSLFISLEPADGRTAGITNIVRGRVDASGNFTTTGVPTGKYILRVSGAPQGWSLRDASHGGKDVTSVAIELDGESATGVMLAFTDKPTELNGTVRDASGNADARASVLVFPADPAGWTDTGSQPRRLRQVRAGQDGTYKINGLPGGDYYVVAVDDEATTGSWQDPAYLGAMARNATQVRLTEGDIKTQALSTMKGGR
jgi:hypothetical protein